MLAQNYYRGGVEAKKAKEQIDFLQKCLERHAKIKEQRPLTVFKFILVLYF